MHSLFKEKTGNRLAEMMDATDNGWSTDDSKLAWV